MLAEGVPFRLKELALRGDELRGIVPAAQTGEVLQKLLLYCAQDGRRNKRDTLLAEAKRLEKQQKSPDFGEKTGKNAWN